MKQITFLRHAKSDWNYDFLKDIDRPLNERGYKEAYSQSEWFLKNNQIPDLIYSSTATRALSTALIFTRALNFPMSNFITEAGLYECSMDFLIGFCQKQNKQYQHIMLVGHNPVTTSFCNSLLKTGFIDEVPTCGFVSVKFNTDTWLKIEENTGEMDFYNFPQKK